MGSAAVTRATVHDELERVRHDLRDLVDSATARDMRRRTDGTRWTNRQLLFHMLLGYFVVRAVLPLTRILGQAPAGVSRAFARTLNAGSRPFHVVNYLGACAGAWVLSGRRLLRAADRTFAALHRRLDRESEESLARAMHFPVDWDPFFTDTMTVLQVYHYGTEHFDFHRRQLTLGGR
jgi:hypothetical protein